MVLLLLFLVSLLYSRVRLMFVLVIHICKISLIPHHLWLFQYIVSLWVCGTVVIGLFVQSGWQHLSLFVVSFDVFSISDQEVPLQRWSYGSWRLQISVWPSLFQDEHIRARQPVPTTPYMEGQVHWRECGRLWRRLLGVHRWDVWRATEWLPPAADCDAERKRRVRGQSRLLYPQSRRLFSSAS